MHFSTVLPDCISGWAVWGAKCNEVNSREDSLTLIFTGNPPSLPPRCTPDAPANVLNPLKEVFSQHHENGPQFWGPFYGFENRPEVSDPLFSIYGFRFKAFITQVGAQSISRHSFRYHEY